MNSLLQSVSNCKRERAFSQQGTNNTELPLLGLLLLNGECAMLNLTSPLRMNTELPPGLSARLAASFSGTFLTCTHTYTHVCVLQNSSMPELRD